MKGEGGSGGVGEWVISLVSPSPLSPSPTQRHLRADERAQPRRPGCLVETRRAVNAVGIDQGDGGKAQPRGFFHQVLGRRRAVQEGERGRGVELGVGRGAGPGRSRLPNALLQLLLARPRPDDRRDRRRFSGDAEVSRRRLGAGAGGRAHAVGHARLWRKKGVRLIEKFSK